jgi:hypothetical protein
VVQGQCPTAPNIVISGTMEVRALAGSDRNTQLDAPCSVVFRVLCISPRARRFMADTTSPFRVAVRLLWCAVLFCCGGNSHTHTPSVPFFCTDGRRDGNHHHVRIPLLRWFPAPMDHPLAGSNLQVSTDNVVYAKTNSCVLSCCTAFPTETGSRGAFAGNEMFVLHLLTERDVQRRPE